MERISLNTNRGGKNYISIII